MTNYLYNKMDTLEITLNLNKKDYPILANLNEREFEASIIKIFKSGYMIHFPSNDIIKQHVSQKQLIERINMIKEELKNEMKNSEITNKLQSLELSLNKLIGLSSNSSKKGNFGENVLEEIFAQRYGDITFERKSAQAHSGDAWLHLPDNSGKQQTIMLEIKNYTTTVNKDEVTKLRSDMINHHMKWGILASFNSNIQGMKELDFYTFSHNNEIYSVIMISNLTTDIHKLDLGLMIIRKLMLQLDNMEQIPLIVKDINNSLNELNQIIQKNYSLRDKYYTMEKEIQKSLSSFHVDLRDYQYDIEKKINDIINKIKNTKTSIEYVDTHKELLKKYEEKQIFPIIVRITDVIRTKKWSVIYDEEEGNHILNSMGAEIGRLKVQAKKAIITILHNDLTLNLHLGKEKENKQNLDIIKTL